MATILRSGNFVNVSGIAADVSHEDIFSDPHEIKIKSIEFIVGSANDIIVIKNGADDKAEICRLGSGTAAESAVKYFGEGTLMKILIDQSACTLNNNHMLIIEIA